MTTDTTENVSTRNRNHHRSMAASTPLTPVCCRALTLAFDHLIGRVSTFVPSTGMRANPVTPYWPHHARSRWLISCVWNTSASVVASRSKQGVSRCPSLRVPTAVEKVCAQA